MNAPFPREQREASAGPASTLTDADIPALRNKWVGEFKEVHGPPPGKLPPMRAVNHEIRLINPELHTHYRAPSCPDALVDQLSDKITTYSNAGLWVPCTDREAIPLLCIFKKNGKLRTPIDARARNANTHLDVTPLPDQDWIRDAVARGKYVSKLDMTDAFEQIRILPEHVKHTTFSTIFGTYRSQVLQQGDLNGPSTMQRLMTWVFRDRIGKSVYVYIDDIFIVSDTIEQHEDDLAFVLRQLKKESLYIAPHKVQIYAESVECLGHVIDRRGIHADADKMAKIRAWKAPRDYKGIERFLGLVQYLAAFMPDVASYTSVLSGMCANGAPFVWRAIHQKAFDSIKAITLKAPILRPIDPRSGEPIWVIGDASVSGVGAMLGQGKDWKTCHPAGFLSKKFTNAQRAYFTYEQETLALLEALLKWEDKLLGRSINLVTDHKSLQFFMIKDHKAPRQIRWSQYFARFKFEVTYIEGSMNKVADALSRYYSDDTETDVRLPHDFVTADIRLDREGDDLPQARFIEAEEMLRNPSEPFAIKLRAMTRAQLKRLANESGSKPQIMDRREPRDDEAARLEAFREDRVSISKGVEPARATDNPSDTRDDPELLDVSADHNFIRPLEATDDRMMATIKKGYLKDAVLKKVIEHPEGHTTFRVRDGIVYRDNQSRKEVLCIPSILYQGRKLTEQIIDHVHSLLGHKGEQRTSEYIRRFYWWPKMGLQIEKFCSSCSICATTKNSNRAPAGLLHSLPIPDAPWNSIAMDFVGPFPMSHDCNYLMVVTCRLSSMCRLIPTVTTVKASELAWLYLKEIVKIHGTPKTIVSDRDPKFTSVFWKEVHRLSGTELNMSTAFHPQTDGTSERKIRDVNAALRAVVKPDQTDWAEKIPMVEFALNSSLNESTGFTPFEIATGRLPTIRTELPVPASKYPGVEEFVANAVNNYILARDALIVSRVRQTHNANRRRTEDPMFEVGSKVYLSTKNLSLPKGRADKLLPKFVGPYEIIESYAETSNYKLDLPDALVARNIHPVFHVSLLRRYEPNDEGMFPFRRTHASYDFGTPDNEFLVETIAGHKWEGPASRRKVLFEVKWANDDVLTWEPLKHVNRLKALDDYLDLQGVKEVHELPGRSPKKQPQNVQQK